MKISQRPKRAPGEALVPLTPADHYRPDELQFLRWGLVLPEDGALLGLVIHALSRLKKSAADQVAQECLFAMPGDRAFYIPAGVVGGRSIVLLPRGILQLSREEQLRVILHEIAHHLLNHRSPRLASFTQEDYERQERDAHRLARKWQKGAH